MFRSIREIFFYKAGESNCKGERNAGESSSKENEVLPGQRVNHFVSHPVNRIRIKMQITETKFMLLILKEDARCSFIMPLR